MTVIDKLRAQRASLIRRNIAGKPGVSDIRARLRAVTLELLRLGG